jgi:phosphoadenosine phosphosulfate reductase
MNIAQLQKDLEPKSAEELLKWAVTEFGHKLAFANSFGAEDVVITYLLAQITKTPYIFTLDTGRLPQETYQVWAQLEDKYKVKIRPFFPQTQAVEKMVNEKGINLFYESIENRKLCCQIRKVEPLNRALADSAAWITGLRRQQAVTRTEIKKIEADASHAGKVKLSPLADWTETQVWEFIKKNKIPYNKLHDLGYPSIGCAPCTRAIKPGEDVRAGRWWWENPDQKECGLHDRRHNA